MMDFYIILFLVTTLSFEAYGVYVPICPDGTGGVFPYPADCTKFIDCNHKQPIFASCSAGSTFNQLLKSCDNSVRIEDCNYEGISRQPAMVFCPRGHSGNYPHPLDCKKYVACSNGIPYVMNCPAGIFYNPLLDICDWPQNVPGCSKDFGNGVKLRGDITFALSNPGDDNSNNGNIDSQSIQDQIQLANGQNSQSSATIQSLYNQNNYEDRKNHISGNEIQIGNQKYQNAQSNYNTNYFGNTNNNQFTNNDNSDLLQNENHFGNHPFDQSAHSSKSFEDQPNYAIILNGSHQHPSGHLTESSGNQVTVNKPYLFPQNGVSSNGNHVNFPSEEINRYTQYPLSGDLTGSISNQVTVTKPYLPGQHVALSIGDHDNFSSEETNRYNQYPLAGDLTGSSNNQEAANEEEENSYDIDVRIKNDGSPSQSSFKPSNNLRNRSLSIDGILDINNLAEENGNLRGTVTSKSPGSPYDIEVYPNIHGRILNSPNNWWNGSPLEPIINENSNTRNHNTDWRGISNQMFNRRSDVIWPSMNPNFDKTEVEVSPSINVINYNYGEDYLNNSVEIDQDHSNIRKYTNNFANKNNNNQDDRSVQLTQQFSEDRPITGGSLTSFRDADTSIPSTYVVPANSPDHIEDDETIMHQSGQTLRLRGGIGSHDGYVEVRGSQSKWGLLGYCNKNWSVTDADKFCKQLGFKRGAKMVWIGLTNDAKIPSSFIDANNRCQYNETAFYNCESTDSECNIMNDAVGVECFLDQASHCNNDEVTFHKNCYYFVNRSLELSHDDAIDYCSSRNSSFLYITSQRENDFISEWLMQKYPQVMSVMTAGIGFTTMQSTLWFWQDSAKSMFRFTKWWPGWRTERYLPPSTNTRGSCVVIKKQFQCYNQPNLNCDAGYFFWDTEDCTASMKGHYYICKRPYNYI